MRQREDQMKQEVNAKNEVIEKLRKQITAMTRPSDQVNMIADMNELQLSFYK